MATPGTSAPLYPYKAVLPAPLYWLYRVYRTLLVAFAFAIFWLSSVLVGWLCLPIVALWPGTRERKMGRGQRVVQIGFGVFHVFARVIRLYHRTTAVKVARPSGVPADSPVVLVANHPTLLDTTSIVSSFPRVVAAVGLGFANNPLLGKLLRLCGFVRVDGRMLHECEERLRMGFDVLIFPEGTRSPRDGGLHPFQRGAFELAARAKVPVVLMKLTCSPSALSKRLPIWKHPDRMAVLTMEPFDTIYPADSELDSRAWARTIEQRYQELLGYSALASELQSVGGVQ
jgi:1-acyl-sn-glycerol-3-phosphate acyltransferase